jgi:hypothetical protein
LIEEDPDREERQTSCGLGGAETLHFIMDRRNHEGLARLVHDLHHLGQSWCVDTIAANGDNICRYKQDHLLNILLVLALFFSILSSSSTQLPRHLGLFPEWSQWWDQSNEGKTTCMGK